MYQLNRRQKAIAKELGVQVFPSDNPKYKVDIYDWNGIYILSCGARGYNDYFLFKKKYGKEYAEERRHLYFLRHHKDLKILGSRGYYCWCINWAGGTE